MAISDHDRKILWGRSGSRCALCRTPLVAAKTTTDPEAIAGDECHIVARARGGPRAGDPSEGQNDAYDNLILLCKVDHKVVDDQPIEYPIERLRRMKEEHETWVADTLSSCGEPSRIEVVDDPSAPPAHLTLLSTGARYGRSCAALTRHASTGLRTTIPIKRPSRLATSSCRWPATGA